MASKNLTFDPSAGVPYAANLTIYTGTDFKTTFNVTFKLTFKSRFEFTL